MERWPVYNFWQKDDLYILLPYTETNITWVENPTTYQLKIMGNHESLEWLNKIYVHNLTIIEENFEF